MVCLRPDPPDRTRALSGVWQVVVLVVLLLVRGGSTRAAISEVQPGTGLRETSRASFPPRGRAGPANLPHVHRSSLAYPGHATPAVSSGHVRPGPDHTLRPGRALLLGCRLVLWAQEVGREGDLHLPFVSHSVDTDAGGVELCPVALQAEHLVRGQARDVETGGEVAFVQKQLDGLAGVVRVPVDGAGKVFKAGGDL